MTADRPHSVRSAAQRIEEAAYDLEVVSLRCAQPERQQAWLWARHFREDLKSLRLLAQVEDR